MPCLRFASSKKTTGRSVALVCNSRASAAPTSPAPTIATRVPACVAIAAGALPHQTKAQPARRQPKKTQNAIEHNHPTRHFVHRIHRVPLAEKPEVTTPNAKPSRFKSGRLKKLSKL